ncbi:hypothetical protein BON30_36300 [Cystobacter ferrugineus]|uniref:Uncharacterized protein n=1 Tax=Cystobacter ferrugineus TaxID=83449 RepID=A0A1L9B1B6_9BACT|nr:hypothetical protein BON30_36300 [Cystobacter ferrugineus]
MPTVRGGAEVASVAATLRVLTPQQQSRIEQELVACAEWAHEHVNHLRLGGSPPTHEQCQEVLATDGCGRKVTRAMQLGSEKHERAIQCTRERLEIVPDVVIHSGNPLEALAVYDFKFPCPTRNPPNWRNYPQGHPYHRSNQGEMYEAALRVKPRRVAPVWKLLDG